MKAVVIVAVVATPASIAWLLYRLRADLFWALPAFVTSFGYAFCWGFVDFMLAVPIGVVLIASALDYSNQPGTRQLLTVLSLTLLCFTAHILVLGLAGLVAASVIVCSPLTHRQRLLGLGALASAVPPFVAITWAAQHVAPPDTAHSPLEAAFGLQRVRDLFAYQVGIDDPNGTLVVWGAVLLLLPFAMGARPSTTLKRWLPFGLTMLVFFAIPKDMFGVAFIYGRYAVFLLPTLLMALDAPQLSSRSQRLFAFGIVMIGLSLVAVKIKAFDNDASSINPVLAKMPPYRRVLYLGVDNTSPIVPLPRIPAFWLLLPGEARWPGRLLVR